MWMISWAHLLQHLKKLQNGPAVRSMPSLNCTGFSLLWDHTSSHVRGNVTLSDCVCEPPTTVREEYILWEIPLASTRTAVNDTHTSGYIIHSCDNRTDHCWPIWAFPHPYPQQGAKIGQRYGNPQADTAWAEPEHYASNFIYRLILG